MTHLVARLAIAALMLTATACGDPASDPDQPGGGSETYEGTWQLVEGHGPEGQIHLVAGYRVTMHIDGTSAGGTSACNSYGGDISIDGGSFTMRDGSMTGMACRPDVMETETAYLAALGAADGISRRDATLLLTGEGTELRFELMPPVPTADLIDTRWQLESLIHGPAEDSVVSSAAPADLLLKADGTLTGSTGCRELHGEWIERGDEILFSTFGADGKCPEALREQDGHVVEVLGDGFTAEVEGDRLTVFSRGGSGLSYRSEG